MDMPFVFMAILLLVDPFAAAVSQLNFRSELAGFNGTFPDDASNDIAVIPPGPSECEILVDSSQEVELVSGACPLPNGSFVIDLDAHSDSALEFFVIGSHPFVHFRNSSSGKLYLSRPVHETVEYKVSVAVTNLCGMYTPVSVAIRVKCAISALSTSATPDSHVPIRGKDLLATEQPVCPPRLVFPSDGLIVVGCDESQAVPFSLLPGTHVGQLVLEGSANYSYEQLGLSNFNVDANGTILTGGYVISDGFRGGITVNISDVLCSENLLVALDIHVECDTTSANVSNLPLDSTNSNSTESFINLTSASLLDGFLAVPMERSEPTTSISTNATLVNLGIPAGADL